MVIKQEINNDKNKVKLMLIVNLCDSESFDHAKRKVRMRDVYKKNFMGKYGYG